MATKNNITETADETKEIVDAVEKEETKETKKSSKSAIDVNAMAEQMAQMAEMIKTLQAELQNKTEKVNLNISHTDTKPVRVLSEETKKEIARQEELVEYRPFYDANNYKDDIFVEVNGRAFLINREKAYMNPVKIPRYVYDALMESEKNSLKLKSNKETLSAKYESNFTKLN